jgi:hypothetical protein
MAVSDMLGSQQSSSRRTVASLFKTPTNPPKKKQKMIQLSMLFIFAAGAVYTYYITANYTHVNS